MTKLKEDLNDFLEKWDKDTEEHNRSEKAGEDKEELADNLWNLFDFKEKKYVLEKAGYEL